MPDNFSIRNITCDHYLSPINEFNSDRFGHLNGLLPVVRIFGIVEETGQKCCAHIHGVFPYILLKTLSPLNDQLERLITTMLKNILSNVPPNQDEPIALLKEVEAKSIYGYVNNDDYFVQIYFKNPRHVQIAAQEFQKQSLTNANMQPFFAHIPYILQFFIEYDIFGMDYVHFDKNKVHFRSPPSNLSLNTLNFSTSPLMPSTRMEVEFDVFEDAIQNSNLLSNSQFVNAGLKLIYTDELARCNSGQIEGLSPEGVKDAFEITKTEVEYLNKLKEYCEKCTQSSGDLNSDSASSQLDVFSQVNDTILLNQRVESSTSNDDQQEVNNFEDFDMWNDMEMEVRGFDPENDEDFNENEEILLESDDDEMSNNFANNDFSLNFNSNKPVKRKSGIVRPVYPTVSSNPEHSLEDTLVTIHPAKNKFHSRMSTFDELQLTQIPFVDEPKPKHARVEQEPANISDSSSGIQHLNAMAVEVFALPKNKNTGIANPDSDPIFSVAIAICPNVTKTIEFCYEKVIMISDELIQNEKVTIVKNEDELFCEFIDVINRFDPDILIGYDLLRYSFGYLIERAIHLQNSDFLERVCRIKNARTFKDPSIYIGRIKLEVWKIVRHESPMRSYAFSSLVANFLNRPFPELQINDLITLNESGIKTRLVAAFHFLEMAKYDILLLDAINVFVRTSQMSRVFGIQFTEVLSRGSQFRVESMLLRVAKQFNYLPPSVGIAQRNLMDSPQTIPLNLEPISGIYREAVAVLDFQSLYPSVCIAYNYCFSTCLGKISQICGTPNQQNIKLGALEYCTLPANELKRLIDSDLIHISPTGGVFVKESVKQGILPKMLKELLDTRLMVKKSMKHYKNNKKMYRMLDAQQLALKLVANVSYGYTAANWSGRMPCDVVADSIVSKGREALENAIKMINTSDKYNGGKVVYGDTDSCFVHFEDCSREEAFELGRRIADDVTAMNPYPMKLKFEKIMQPCVLLTKKRYVGNSFENSPDDEPKFDAKGIETVRRDGCLFTSKLVKKCLNILFQSDATTVIHFLRQQLQQIQRFPISDFILNAEFRDHYSENAVIPSKKLALERKQKSPRLAPVHGERLPFLIVMRNPSSNRKKLPLIDCVVSWQEFLANKNLQINFNYYVSRQLFSALGRFLDLVPVKLHWRPIITSNICIGCKKVGIHPFCGKCTKSVTILQRALIQDAHIQRQKCQLIRACNECITQTTDFNLEFITCANMSCNFMEQRLQTTRSPLQKTLQKHSLYEITNKPIYLSD